MSKKAFMYDWSGEWDPNKYPARGRVSLSSITFSVGVFQWIPTKDGKRLKKSKVIKRFRGYTSQPEEVYKAAQAYCDKLNTKRS